MQQLKAIIITIGDELLIGQTIDTNSSWIAQHLNVIGIEVVRRIAVGDTKQAIVKVLDEEQKNGDILLITGGLGPTSDDITKPLLCEYFGGKLIVNEAVLEYIKKIFSKLNRPIIERNLKQAEVPDVCTVLFNRMGTAPGMWFEKNSKIFIAMPGVPFEMVAIMEDEVLPRLQSISGENKIVHCTTVTAGEGESFIAERLIEFERQLPFNIKLAYLPDASFVKLRLTGMGNEESRTQEKVKLLQNQLVGILHNIVIATDDLAMENILAAELSRIKKTMGIAESCTGGYIGHALTQVPGASSFFMGSIVSYDNSVKQNILKVKGATLEEFGAVSEQTAKEMAIGALEVLKTDFVLATTGVLGPTGGTDRVRVGTVWMAVTDGSKIVAKEFYFRYDRLKNKDMAAKNGMLLMWKFITGRL